MQITLNFHFDAGHGWVEVPQTLIMQLGLVKSFSRYSYFKDNTAYLEEDCDAGILVNALKAKGYEVSFNEINNGDDSKIRSYPRYA